MTNFMKASKAINTENLEENILRILAEINAEKEKEREKDSTYDDFLNVEFSTNVYKDTQYIVHYGYRSIKRKLLPRGEEELIEIAIRFVFSSLNEPIIDYNDIKDELMAILANYHDATTLLIK